MDEVLEQNQDAKQVRKTGNETVSSEELTKFPFDNVQLEKFLSFPKDIQEEFLLREFELVTRLLDLENFGPAEAAHFLSFTVQTQETILQLGNSPLSSLLVQKMEEEIILNTLTPEGIDLSQSSILQKLNAPSDPLQESIFALADELRESGNSWIFDEFLKRAGGVVQQRLVGKGLVCQLSLAVKNPKYRIYGNRLSTGSTDLGKSLFY